MAAAPGNFLRFYNKGTGKYYGTAQEAFNAPLPGQAPQGPAPVTNQMTQAYTKATGRPYYGPGSFKGTGGGAQNIQQWYANQPQQQGGGAPGGGGMMEAPRGPGGMGGGAPGYNSALPGNVDDARARMLGNISATRGAYGSPQAQALMNQTFGTATGGQSPLLQQVAEAGAGARANLADANARAQQLQMGQIRQRGGMAGVNTGQAQIEAQANARRNQMDMLRQQGMDESALKTRLMAGAQDQYSQHLRDRAQHQLGVTGIEAPLMSKMYQVEEDDGWGGALGGGGGFGGGGGEGMGGSGIPPGYNFGNMMGSRGTSGVRGGSLFGPQQASQGPVTAKGVPRGIDGQAPPRGASRPASRPAVTSGSQAIKNRWKTRQAEMDARRQGRKEDYEDQKLATRFMKTRAARARANDPGTQAKRNLAAQQRQEYIDKYMTTTRTRKKR